MCFKRVHLESSPLYPLFLLLNRDEYYDRPTKPISWWEGCEILGGGRDEKAGGTWLACTRESRLAFLTNVMEPPPLPKLESRGHLTKTQWLHNNFKELLDKFGKGEIPSELMVEELMLGKIKADKSRLPHIRSFEWEYNSSSIFVDFDNWRGSFGTRSTTALTVKASGEMRVYEKHLGKEGWEEHTVNYQIEKAG